jgi:phage anti-repressor protein
MNIFINKKDLIHPETINFTELVKNTNTIIKLGDEYQSKMIDILNNEFTDKESQWYIANLYIYMNYHPTNEYPINLENVYKMIGFANKGNAMKTIKRNFIKDEDYKIFFFQMEKNKSEETRGRKEETIMLNIDTFKNLCMISKTECGKEIRKYYVKLENIYNKLIKEELDNQKKMIEEKDKLIQDLENKPDTEGFSSREGGEIYVAIDLTKKGHTKIGMIGMSTNLDMRLSQLNVGSSTQSLQLYMHFKTFDKILAERLIHQSLHPFRIKNRKEWFYFKNNLELAYAINAIKQILAFIEQYNIQDSTQFQDILKNINMDEELPKQKTLDELQKETEQKTKDHNNKIKKINQNVGQQGCHRTGNFKGVGFVTEKQQWLAQIQYNYNNVFLGYYTDEIDGAKAYNDYAAYLNQTENTNFALNDIPGYKTVARNIPELNKQKINEKKSSKYNGVSYDSKRKCYVVSIKLSNKTYNLGSNSSEIECAKLYNQQALFFNNKFNTNYTLNDISDYVTIPKDVYSELSSKKIKTSKYNGVSLTKDNKWACSYMMNRKKHHIGTFDTELEACKAYNDTVSKLNENGCNYKINKI